jgi:hypothetical protein
VHAVNGRRVSTSRFRENKTLCKLLYVRVCKFRRASLRPVLCSAVAFPQPQLPEETCYA